MKNAGSISSTGLRLGGMLLCGTVLYFFANVQRVAIPGAVFNLLQEQWNVSAPYITGLGSAFMYVYALNQLFIGLLVDRYGGVRVIAAGALLFCTGSILFPLSDSLGLLYFSRALTGLGASALYLSLIKETMRLFERNYNIVLALIIMIGYAGGIMANAPFVAGVEAIGLRKMLLLTGGVSILFYLLFLGTGATMKLPRIRRDVPVSFRKFGTVLKCRHNRDLFLFSGVNFGLYYVLQTVIGKKFLEDFCAMGETGAAWILSLLGVISALSSFASGALSAAFGNRRRVFVRIAGLGCLISFLALHLATVFDFRTPWLALVFCILTVTANISPVTISLLRETNTPNVTGVSVSFLNFGNYIMVALLGTAAGLLMDLFPPQICGQTQIYGRDSYLAVFTLLFLLSCIVCGCAFRLRETNGINCASTTH